MGKVTLNSFWTPHLMGDFIFWWVNFLAKSSGFDYVVLCLCLLRLEGSRQRCNRRCILSHQVGCQRA